MLISTTRRVDRDVVEMDDTSCAEVDCVHDDAMFGVRVTRVEETTYFGLLSIDSEVGTNVYCPFHTDDTEASGQALQRQQEKEAETNFTDIVESEVIPTFRLSDGTLTGPAGKRSKARLSSDDLEMQVDEAKEIMSHITTPHPLLLVIEPSETAFVFGTDERRIEMSFDATDAPSLSSFRDTYEVEWYEREYYIVRTADVTNTRSSNLRRAVDTVVERGAYKTLRESPWRINWCPACSGSRVAVRGIHRVEIDGREELVPFHTYNRCKRHLGIINREMVNEDELEYQ